jgi:DNA-directed RNA polymerase subunit RPC12/RpoP
MYKCQECGKGFQNPGALRTHKMWKHEIQSKDLSQKNNLKSQEEIGGDIEIFEATIENQEIEAMKSQVKSLEEEKARLSKDLSEAKRKESEARLKIEDTCKKEKKPEFISEVYICEQCGCRFQKEFAEEQISHCPECGVEFGEVI